jgi:hypothetical protein
MLRLTKRPPILAVSIFAFLEKTTWLLSLFVEDLRMRSVFGVGMAMKTNRR